MNLPPVLEEAAIEQCVGRRGLRRGRDYYRSGAIYDGHRKGWTITAHCAGRSVAPYRVRVVLAEGGVKDAFCSCPVGSSGNCKHVAAVLLAWREQPNTFTEIESLGEVLHRLDRGQLIELLSNLVGRHPDLEEVMDGLVPEQAKQYASPSPEKQRREVAGLLSAPTVGDDLTPEQRIDKIRVIKEAGDAYINQHETIAAADVYRAIVEEWLRQADQGEPWPSELDEVLEECLSALGLSLVEMHGQTEPRKRIMRTLMDALHQELTLREAVREDLFEPILEYAVAEEIEMVSGWFRRWIEAGDSAWIRRVLGGLLLQLSADRLDDVHYVSLCRQTGRHLDAARRLVARGRIDEAVAESESADTYDFLKGADLLARRHHAELAESMVRRRQATHPEEAALGEWLARFEQSRAKALSALDLSEQLFRLEPDMATYQRVRSLARQVGRWEELHGSLLAYLEQSGRYELLVSIHLDEQSIDRAVEAVSLPNVELIGWGLALKVASAAERSRPEEAAELYTTHVERLLAHPIEDGHVEVARHLRKIHPLLRRVSGEQAWNRYLTDLRTAHRLDTGLLSLLESEDW